MTSARIVRCTCHKLIIFGQTCTCGHNMHRSHDTAQTVEMRERRAARERNARVHGA